MQNAQNNISEKIIALSKEIDDKIEKIKNQLVGIKYISDFSLTLQVKFSKMTDLPHNYINIYNNYLFLLPELGIIRSVRYIGKDNKLKSYSEFEINKMERKRDESSKLGDKISGSFITFGNINVKENPNLQILSPILLNMIHLLSKIEHNKNKNLIFPTIFPTPLSLITSLDSKNNNKSIIINPAVALVLLDYSNFQKKFLDILGYHNLKSIIVKGYFISCLPIKINNLTININNVVKCTKIGPYKIIFPYNMVRSDELIKSYKGKRIITYIQGIWVFNDKPYFTYQNNTDYFLALDEIPYIPQIEAMMIFGEANYISINRTKIIYKDINGSSKQLSNNISEKVVLDISTKKDIMNNYISKINRVINYFEQNKGYHSVLENQKFDFLFKNQIDKYYWCDDINCHLYIPLLLTLISEEPNITYKEKLLNELKLYNKQNSSINNSIDINNVKENQIIIKILKRSQIHDIWFDIFKKYKDLIYQNRLRIII